MNPEMKIIREVNIQAENFYNEAVKLGDHAAYAIKTQHRSQMTNLENIAESSFKATDILDFIKKQTARFSYWRQPFPEDKDANTGFGERLKRYLENNLQTTVNPPSAAGPSMLDPNLSVKTVVTGLSQPTTMAFIGANDFLVLEKNTGKVQRVVNGAVQSTMLDLAVNSASERGLLGIATAAAALAWWWNFERGRKALAFYGAQTARLIRTAPRVEIL